jgi:hypothetical protein
MDFSAAVAEIRPSIPDLLASDLFGSTARGT